jgi:hypothetical protein
VRDLKVAIYRNARKLKRSWRKAYFRRSRDRQGALELRSHPVTYLITFACYGCHLHGDASEHPMAMETAAHLAALEYVVAEQGDAMSVFESHGS